MTLMPDSAPTITTHTIATNTNRAVEVTIRERGNGRTILLLHGGGGPLTVARFADLLAERKPARVLTPTHPGFGGTVQPDTVGSIRALAELYVALLEDLDVHDVTVVGNSIGGWVAAEMAILNNPRISGIVLVDAVGIDVPGHPVADFFALTFPQIAQLSYYHPAAFQIDPSTLTPAQQALMAGNRAALARYVGTESMSDSTLATRLGEITTPALAVWGAADRIVDTEYGRAFARAMPTATFSVIEKSGHLPQLESPDELLAHLWDFATRTR